MQNAALSSYNEFRGLILQGVFQQCCRAAYLISKLHHRSLALRVYQHFCLRMLTFEFKDFLYAKTCMNMTGTIPQQHISAGNGIDISTQILIRTEDDRCFLRQ